MEAAVPEVAAAASLEAPQTVPRGYGEPKMAIDGIMRRKTSFGAWRERYFRTTRHELAYWSKTVEEIKLTKAVRGRGPYQYVPVGSPSETYDLRRPGLRVVLSNGVIELQFGSGEVLLDLRPESFEDTKRWYEVLGNIVRFEASRAARVIGSLDVEIDGVYLVGPVADKTERAAVKAQIRYDGVMAASEEAIAQRLRSTLYENVHEEEDKVSYAPLSLSFSRPCHRANASFRVTLFAEEMTQSVSSVLAHAMGKKDTQKPTAVASRRISLFELQARESSVSQVAANLCGARRKVRKLDDDSHLSALEGDASQAWPTAGPDGRAPRRGFVFYPIFEKEDKIEADGVPDDEKDDKLAASRVVALLHAKLRYRESLVAVVDPDGQERFEYEFLEDEDQDEAREDKDEIKHKDREVGLEALTIVLARLGLVVEKLADLKPDVFDWEQPWVSAASWVATLVICLGLPYSASLALIPCVMLAWLVFSLGASTQTRLAALEDAGKVKRLDDNADRQLATVRIAVLKGTGLAAADLAMLHGSDNSDPYVAVFAQPGDPDARAIDAMAPTLVGITDVKMNTLNPAWCDDAAKGVNATRLSTKQRVTLFGEPGSSASAPADFRVTWVHSDKTLKGACWAFPVLQEMTETGGGIVRVPRPWTQQHAGVVFEVYDQNLVTNEAFLGVARLDISELASHVGEPRVYEIPLGPSGMDKKDRGPVNTHLKRGLGLGTLTVEASLEPVDDADLKRSNPRLAATNRALAADVFERKAFKGGLKKKSRSAYGNVKEIRRGLRSAYETVETATSMLERLWALMSWDHPLKTLLVAFGLVAGIAGCCLVPNNLICAGLMSKFFLTGLVVKLRGDDLTIVKKVDSSEIQLKNLLRSLPNAPQREQAFKSMRALYSAQALRNDAQAKISLAFGLRVRYQAYVYCYKQSRALTLPSWEREYLVVVDGALHFYASTQAARKDPAKNLRRKLFLVPPPLGGAWQQDDALSHADRAALPADRMPVFFVAVYASKHHDLLSGIGNGATTEGEQGSAAKQCLAVKSKQALDAIIAAVAAEATGANHNLSEAVHNTRRQSVSTGGASQRHRRPSLQWMRSTAVDGDDASSINCINTDAIYSSLSRLFTKPPSEAAASNDASNDASNASQ